MSVHHLFATAATVPLAVPPADVLAGPVGAYDLTTGRLWSVVAALLGLAGAVIGGLALARATGRIGTGSGRIGTGSGPFGTGRRGAVVALVAGAAGTAIGGLVVAAADGGPGTGYGIVGGFMALAVGLIALLLGGLALARSRRGSSRSSRP